MGNGADLTVTEDSKQCKVKSSLHAQTWHILGKRFVYAWKVRTHAMHQISTRLPKPCSWNPFHPANIAKVLPEIYIYIAHRHSTRVTSFAMENHNQRVQEALLLDTIMDGILNQFYQIRLHGFVSELHQNEQLAEMVLLTNFVRFVIETFFVWLSMCLPGTCVRLLASGRSRLTKCPLTRKLLACSATNCSITFRIHLTIWSTEGLLVDTRSSNRDIAFENNFGNSPHIICKAAVQQRGESILQVKACQNHIQRPCNNLCLNHTTRPIGAQNKWQGLTRQTWRIPSMNEKIVPCACAPFTTPFVQNKPIVATTSHDPTARSHWIWVADSHLSIVPHPMNKSRLPVHP